ncbi:iron transporter [Salisaeta longa]|uniref:iron transporter n=1 Tax=Salisaeta longa TaxID=503170 RepID=UPI000405DB73|nr:iron transporter [Salisaeta longa]
MRTLSRTIAAFVLLAFFALPSAHAQELVLGEEVIDPGIRFTFIGAPEGDVTPKSQNLAAIASDLHLEVLATWTEEAAVKSPAGGFIPYVRMYAQVTNERTDQTNFVTLIPHLNLSDGFHYARNIALPGRADDAYTVTFSLEPPEPSEVAYHADWREQFGSDGVFAPQTFTYENVNLLDVVEASRE